MKFRDEEEIRNTQKKNSWRFRVNLWPFSTSD